METYDIICIGAGPTGLATAIEAKRAGMRPLRSRLLFAALAARLIARQPALHDAVEHLDHFLFRRLARNLEQERLR